MTAGLGTQVELQILSELGQKRQVCWDAFPERVGVRGSTRTVGYELILSGVHTRADEHPTPGCDLCKEVYRDLKRIASWILPEGDRPSVHEIQSYEPIIWRNGKRHHREEVTLSITILHRHGYEDPIDACETRCLREMESKLKELGACQADWRPLS